MSKKRKINYFLKFNVIYTFEKDIKIYLIFVLYYKSKLKNYY